MAAYTVKDFADIYTAVMEELKLGSDDTNAKNRIKRQINQVYIDEVVPFKRWGWLSGYTAVQFKPYYNTGSCVVTPDSTTVTLSIPPGVSAGSKAGYFFAVDNFNEIYTIDTHTAGSATVVLTTPYTGALNSTAGFKIWTENITLPTDCAETMEVWHDFFASSMEALGLQEFRRRRNENQRLENRPFYYTTYDYYDPSSSDGETESDRYRVLKVYPAAYNNSTTIHIDYKKETAALELDGDEPVMPIEDRVVLVYGTLARAWATEARNPEMAQMNRSLYEAKLARMAGKIEDSFDKPQITPDSSYLLNKRGPGIKGRSTLSSSAGGGSSYTAPTYLSGVTINGATITNDVTVTAGKTIDGRDLSVDGAALDTHLAATSGAHAATAISVVPSGNISSTNVGAALNELQTDIDSLTTLADGKIYLGNGSNVATEVTPTGDVTITNAGVTAIGAGKIVNSQVSASAAIAYSKLALTGAILNADLAGSIAYSKLSLTGAILNADLAGSIAYSKLSLTGAILNADLAGSIAYGKLSLTGAILNADLAGSIAYSKLSLSNSILNADINSSAAIAYSKLAALTSAHILVGSAGNVATDVAMSGDISITNAGVTSYAGVTPLSQGRLTLTSGVPVTTSDVTAATTLYYTPYLGDQISLYNGSSAWTRFTFTELNIAVPATTSTMYDVFVFNNSGTPTLELQSWTNDTTRSTVLVFQNGVYVKSGATTRRYVGSFRTTAVSGQTEDSLAKRYVWNMCNRVTRPMLVQESTDSWAYSTATFRQANASTANQLDFVNGINEDAVTASVYTLNDSSTSTFRSVQNGIGLDSTTTNSATAKAYGNANNATTLSLTSSYVGLPGAGRHTLVWLEKGNGTDTQTWYGDAGSTTAGQSAIHGLIRQ